MAGGNSEDYKIRRFFLVASLIAMAVLVASLLIITVMIGTNFNLLNWLE